jgi:hypothetical protein
MSSSFVWRRVKTHPRLRPGALAEFPGGGCGATKDMHVQHFQPGLGKNIHSSAVPPPTLEHLHLSLPEPPTTQSSAYPLASAAAEQVWSQSPFPVPLDCVHTPGTSSFPDGHTAPVEPGAGMGSIAPH